MYRTSPSVDPPSNRTIIPNACHGVKGFRDLSPSFPHLQEPTMTDILTSNAVVVVPWVCHFSCSFWQAATGICCFAPLTLKVSRLGSIPLARREGELLVILLPPRGSDLLTVWKMTWRRAASGPLFFPQRALVVRILRHVRKKGGVGSKFL